MRKYLVIFLVLLLGFVMISCDDSLQQKISELQSENETLQDKVEELTEDNDQLIRNMPTVISKVDQTNDAVFTNRDITFSVVNGNITVKNDKVDENIIILVNGLRTNETKSVTSAESADYWYLLKTGNTIDSEGNVKISGVYYDFNDGDLRLSNTASNTDFVADDTITLMAINTKDKTRSENYNYTVNLDSIFNSYSKDDEAWKKVKLIPTVDEKGSNLGPKCTIDGWDKDLVKCTYDGVEVCTDTNWFVADKKSTSYLKVVLSYKSKDITTASDCVKVVLADNSEVKEDKGYYQVGMVDGNMYVKTFSGVKGDEGYDTMAYKFFIDSENKEGLTYRFKINDGKFQDYEDNEIYGFYNEATTYTDYVIPEDDDYIPSAYYSKCYDKDSLYVSSDLAGEFEFDTFGNPKFTADTVSNNIYYDLTFENETAHEGVNFHTFVVGFDKKEVTVLGYYLNSKEHLLRPQDIKADGEDIEKYFENLGVKGFETDDSMEYYFIENLANDVIFKVRFNNSSLTKSVEDTISTVVKSYVYCKIDGFAVGENTIDILAGESSTNDVSFYMNIDVPDYNKDVYKQTLSYNAPFKVVFDGEDGDKLYGEDVKLTMSFIDKNDENVVATMKGPYGRYSLLTDVDIQNLERGKEYFFEVPKEEDFVGEVGDCVKLEVTISSIDGSFIYTDSCWFEWKNGNYNEKTGFELFDYNYPDRPYGTLSNDTIIGARLVNDSACYYNGKDAYVKFDFVSDDGQIYEELNNVKCALITNSGKKVEADEEGYINIRNLSDKETYNFAVSGITEYKPDVTVTAHLYDANKSNKRILNQEQEVVTTLNYKSADRYFIEPFGIFVDNEGQETGVLADGSVISVKCINFPERYYGKNAYVKFNFYTHDAIGIPVPLDFSYALKTINGDVPVDPETGCVLIDKFINNTYYFEISGITGRVPNVDVEVSVYSQCEFLSDDYVIGWQDGVLSYEYASKYDFIRNYLNDRVKVEKEHDHGTLGNGSIIKLSCDDAGIYKNNTVYAKLDFYASNGGRTDDISLDYTYVLKARNGNVSVDDETGCIAIKMFEPDKSYKFIITNVKDSAEAVRVHVTLFNQCEFLDDEYAIFVDDIRYDRSRTTSAKVELDGVSKITENLVYEDKILHVTVNNPDSMTLKPGKLVFAFEALDEDASGFKVVPQVESSGLEEISYGYEYSNVIVGKEYSFKFVDIDKVILKDLTFKVVFIPDESDEVAPSFENNSFISTLTSFPAAIGVEVPEIIFGFGEFNVNVGCWESDTLIADSISFRFDTSGKNNYQIFYKGQPLEEENDVFTYTFPEGYKLYNDTKFDFVVTGAFNPTEERINVTLKDTYGREATAYADFTVAKLDGIEVTPASLTGIYYCDSKDDEEAEEITKDSLIKKVVAKYARFQKETEVYDYEVSVVRDDGYELELGNLLEPEDAGDYEVTVTYYQDGDVFNDSFDISVVDYNDCFYMIPVNDTMWDKILYDRSLSTGKITSLTFSTDTDLYSSDTNWNVIADLSSDENSYVKAYLKGKQIVVVGDRFVLNENSSNMFKNFGLLRKLDVSLLDTRYITDVSGMFYDCENLTNIAFGEDFDTSAVTNMSDMFRGCTNLKKIDSNAFDTSSVENMAGMFAGCSSIKTLDFKFWDTSELTNMKAMFFDCSALSEIEFGSYFETSNVTNMASLFQNCTSLTDLDLTAFNTGMVEDMSSMFENCSDLTTITDLSGFDTSDVTSMKRMFTSCTSLVTLDLSNSDTTKVEDMTSIFEGCSSLVTLNIAKFKECSRRDRMFGVKTEGTGCNSLKEVYAEYSLLENADLLSKGTGKENWEYDSYNKKFYIPEP